MGVLVGAAGFEPATFWSQTRRATRLRYAPPEPAFDTCFALVQQASLVGLKYGRSHSVARRNPELPGCSTNNLQNSPHRPA